MIESITKSGYVREDFVSIHGQYAIRGSVMDIFLTSGKEPIRIEFFDNKIEKSKNQILSMLPDVGGIRN